MEQVKKIKELVEMLPDGVECIVDTLIQIGSIQPDEKYKKIHEFMCDYIGHFSKYEDWNQSVAVSSR